MRKYRKFRLILALLVLILSGCSKKGPPPAPRLITQVDVTCTRDGQTTQRHYTAPEKTSAILNYIRLLDGHGRPDTDPERILGDAFKIVLHFSDGSRQVYYQRANKYLSRCCRPWENIDPTHGMLLYPLVEKMPSDL